MVSKEQLDKWESLCNVSPKWEIGDFQEYDCGTCCTPDGCMGHNSENPSTVVAHFTQQECDEFNKKYPPEEDPGVGWVGMPLSPEHSYIVCRFDADEDSGDEEQLKNAKANAKFMVAAREALPQLIAEVRFLMECLE